MRSVFIMLCTVLGLAIHAGATEPAVSSAGRLYSDMTMDGAVAYCDTAAIRGIEGVYLWADREAVVLIRSTRKLRSASVEYEIVNIESADIMYPPGAVMGYLYPTGSANDFHAYLFDSVGTDKARKPKHKAAKYNTSEQSIRFEGKQTKFTFNPLALIPRVRSILRIRQIDPMAELPDGLLLIYPVSPASITYPRYL
ncbi:MAG: hypothetical protein NC217_07900 [Muribaculaceae bacterium]|nr:hypothetical protein [Muribaculaceae bacterium]